MQFKSPIKQIFKKSLMLTAILQSHYIYASTNYSSDFLSKIYNNNHNHHYNNSSSVANSYNSYKPYSSSSCSLFDDYWHQKSNADIVTLDGFNNDDTVMQANNISGQTQGVNYASGDVIIINNDKTVNADFISYATKDSHIIANNAKITQNDTTIKGDWLEYYFDKNQGFMLHPVFTNTSSNITAVGDDIIIKDKNHYQINKGYFTTCNLDDPDWSVRFLNTTFDYQNSQGNARGAKVYLKDHEIFSMPFLTFPLGQRKSGILQPEFGNNSNSGYFVGIPYYWNLAPNYDMTITPRFYSIHGFMFTDEFRYLTPTGAGNFYTEQMPSQMNKNDYRYYITLSDNHFLYNKKLITGYKFNQVSDNNYFVDFGNFISGTSNINLESSAFIKYQPQLYTTSIKIQNFQTIQPEGAVSRPIYAALPQVELNLNPINFNNTNFKLAMLNQYTNFTANQVNNIDVVQTGQRIVSYPSISYLAEVGNMYVEPKLAYNISYYSLNKFNRRHSDNMIIRTLPVASIDSAIVLDRNISLFSNNYTQTLEPHIYYLYIPTVDQSNIPNFDTAQASPNIAELFSDNRFAGYDRINAANDITTGFTSKLISHKTGLEYLNFGVAYRYYIDLEHNQQLSNIYGNPTEFQALYQPQPNLITEVTNKAFNNHIISSANFQYDAINKIIDAYNASLQYKDDNMYVLNARFTYQYNLPLIYYPFMPEKNTNNQINNFEDQYALNLSAQIPIKHNFLLNLASTYDFTRDEILNVLTGLEYRKSCWSLRALYQDFIASNTANQNKPLRGNVWFLQLTLNGLTSFGTDPSNNFKINIPGYMPITTIH